jgi:hypothetical protein
LDDQGEVQTFVAARSEVGLADYVNQQVGVTALSVSLRTDIPYLLVDQVTPLDQAASTQPPAPLASVLVDGPIDPVDGQVQLASYDTDIMLDAYGIPQPFDNLAPPVATGKPSCPQCGYGIAQPGATVVPAVPGQPAYPSPALPSVPGAACPCGPVGRIYGRAEFLWWWTTGMDLPELVTTSPLGTPQNSAGILGQPGTSVLLGQEEVLNESHDGARFLIGGWIDRCQWIGLEGDYFFLSEASENFTFSSTGNPILARPFFNVLTGLQAAELAAYPGLVAGSINVTATSELQSVAPRLKLNLLCEAPSSGPTNLPFGYRIDLMGGYRFLQLDESLHIVEQQTTIPDQVGETVAFIHALDQFDTTNTFHGGEVALEWDGYRGPWSVEVLTRLGIGSTNREVQIRGRTRTTTQGVTVNNSGGLLALSSNIGNYEEDRFSLIPEVDAVVGYAVTPQLRLKAGYTLLYWNNVARPGDQIDSSLNPNLFPPEIPNPGAQRPAFALQDHSYWAQGVSVGVDYRW